MSDGNPTLAVQLRLFRDSLAYLSNLTNASANMIFVYVELAIFYIVFHVAFCFGKFTKTCGDPDYIKVRSVCLPGRVADGAHACSMIGGGNASHVLLAQGTSIGTKSLWCLGLFFTASWIACLASKMLSTHFYKSTHFRKCVTPCLPYAHLSMPSVACPS